MSVLSLLREARSPDGRPRFYPTGEHPATARLRDRRDRIAAFPESPMRYEALAWSDLQLAAFEWGEDRAKRDYLQRVSF